MFEAFQNRSGRVISLSRALLATVFLLAIWLDPSQPALAPGQAYTILFLYVLLSAALFAATWNNWWLDVRLALPAHVLDIAVFSVMVFLTEGYTSPFFTFFVFLLLSATIRWGWRETAITAGVVILLFYVAGTAALEWSNGQFDSTRFIIRGTYLLVLSLVLIWFGINLQKRRRGRHLLGSGTSSDPEIEGTLRYAAAQTRAGRLVFAWWDNEEPWINVARLDDGSFSQTRHGPTAFGQVVNPRIEGTPFLFDARTDRILRERAGKKELLRCEPPVDDKFASQFGIQSGLAIPVASSEYGGEIFALDVPGLCADDLGLAVRLSSEVSSALERSASVASSEHGAEARTRLALARDLHDSIVQLLAGTSFRLQAIKNAATAGQDVSSDIDALQQELSQEQKELRSFISELRRKGGFSTNSDLAAGLPKLLERLSRQWGIACELEPLSHPIPGSVGLEHDMHQLIREGVANAVRHGSAHRVVISVRPDVEGVHLQIADTGTGFKGQAGDTNQPGPWSLAERVRSLGGSLAIRSSSQGSNVMITLPLGTKA
jgi:signal transduction histidine kinase